MQKILVVEDDLELNKGLCKALKTGTTLVASAASLAGAREELSVGHIELVILDENLPDGNGLELLGEVKEHYPRTAVIILTANDTDMDIVEGLEKGADDYITKPFSLSILRARVNTQLRKVQAGPERPQVFTTKRYSFDFERMVYIVDGAPVELSKTEQKLLRILVENRGNTVERGILIDRIWTDGAEYVDENALSVSVKRLRDKLDAGENIKTVYGIGYRWVNRDDRKAAEEDARI